MIYSFRTKDSVFDRFIGVLLRESLDYEVIEGDKVVVRIFGRVDEPLQRQLDELIGRPGKLTLMKTREYPDDLKNIFSSGKMLIAGPCSVESEEQLDKIAEFLSDMGIKYLRGGAFKPRTSSRSFQGLGRSGLDIISRTAAKYGMNVVTEVMDRSQLNDVARVADIIQVGSRNMFNYSLLTALGSIEKPVLLKRGMAATVDEWISAADYICKGGNERIILCERGIRTFEPSTRFTLDILAVPVARKKSGLPVIVDVSHAAGKRELVPPLMKAALAAGADGIMVEVHPDPDKALSDGAQSMTFDNFREAYNEIESMNLLGIPVTA